MGVSLVSNRRYWSARTGRGPERLSIDLPLLRRLFYTTYKKFERQCYFQEALGYNCVDEGFVPGNMGPDPESYVFLRLRKSDVWPIDAEKPYSEDDVFDLIEFLYDHVSKPVRGRYHSFAACGWHYETFDKSAGQMEFREAVNEFLRDYQGGWELSENGEILALADPGLDNLFQVPLPHPDEKNVTGRVQAAVRKFRRHKSSIEERRDAVRDLADVLEFLRPQAKAVLAKKDESDLFELANRFGIRHHDQHQKTDYDQSIWLSWMFYYYLATIHAVVRLIERQRSGGAS